MVSPRAAVVVLDYVPDSDEIADIAALHLDDFPADDAHARCQILNGPPDFLPVGDRDQVSAHLRDGAACVLVIYMAEGDGSEDDEEYGEESDTDF